MNIDGIALKNFATYRDQPLDFRRLGKTVAVFGSTGAGKTTFFIDALTLALYGRAYGQKDKESAKWTLPMSETGSMVTLDFTVGDKQYSLCRKVWKTRPAEASLSQVVSVGNTKPLAVGVREVERMLEGIVGFDYQTFLNTVVVRQGDVAALMSQEPKGRRDIFLRAFDVDFTKHKEKAQERRDLASKTVEHLKTKSVELEKAVHEKELLKIKLEQVLESIKTGEKEKQQLLNQLKACKKELKLARTKREMTRSELGRFELMETNLKQLWGEQVEKEKSLKKAEQLLLDKPKILREDKEVQDSLVCYNKVAQFIREISGLKILREQTLKLRRNQLAKTSKKEQAEANLKTIVEKEQQLPDLRSRLAETHEVYEKLSGDAQRLRGIIESVEKSRDALDSAGDDPANCPVCGTALTKEKLQNTRRHLEEELSRLKATMMQLKPELDAAERKKKMQEKEVNEYERAVAIKNRLVEELKEISNAEEELRETEQEIRETDLQLASYEDQCAQFFGAVPTKEQVESSLQKLELKAKQAKEVFDQIAQVEGQTQVLRARLHEIEEQRKELQEELKEAQPLREEDEKLGKLVKELEQKAEDLQSSFLGLEGRLGGYGVSEKDLRERLAKIQLQEEELAKVKDSLAEQSKQYQAFDLLYSEIFHEKGFPLVLLRDFLQDVELNAESYIQRFMPDKSIRVDADEDGRVAIDIVDGASVRELATYSGGETVLIGFAVRLGIARAIAERNIAYAPRFLIIDEGFGPLSPEFRREVLKMLNELSQDYERIIVISHVDDVRESMIFANQIHVSKDGEGHSKLEIH